MFGGGVVVFHDGKIMGGDGTYYYLGEYILRGNALQATLVISPFIAGAASVFRTVGHNVTLKLDGSLVDERRVTAQGFSNEMPNVKFGVKLTKRS